MIAAQLRSDVAGGSPLPPPAATHQHYHPAIRHSASGNQGSEARTRLAFPCIVVIHQMLDVVYLYKYVVPLLLFILSKCQEPGSQTERTMALINFLLIDNIVSNVSAAPSTLELETNIREVRSFTVSI